MSRQRKLIDYVAQVRAKRFRPGEHDCAIFVNGWVRMVTGEDHSRGLIGTYKTLEAGRAALRVQGLADHIALAASVLDEIPPAMARTGDLAVVNGDALGIVSADVIFVLHPHDGLGHVGRMLADRAFKV